MPAVAVCRRQQADQDLGAAQKGVEPAGAVEGLDARRCAFGVRLQPATRNPSRWRTAAASRPSTPRPITPTATSLAGGWSCSCQRRCALLRVIAALPAMMHQHVERDVFGHPHREVGIDDAHERDLRQLPIAHQMIDAGAEREDRLEMRQSPRAVRPAGARRRHRSSSAGSPTRCGHTRTSRCGASVRKRSCHAFGSIPVTAIRIAPISAWPSRRSPTRTPTARRRPRAPSPG